MPLKPRQHGALQISYCIVLYVMIIASVWHTHTQPFNGLWSGTTRVGQYQKKHSPTHTHPGHRTSFINFLHLLWSVASSLFSLHAWQSSRTTSLQVLFGLFLVLDPLLHTRCISSPNHRLLFTARAHTITACSAVIPMLCHLYLISQLLNWKSVF